MLNYSDTVHDSDCGTNGQTILLGDNILLDTSDKQCIFIRYLHAVLPVLCQPQ